MRYEDASLSGSFQDTVRGPDARDDTDALAAGSRGPATGNTVSGAGTITGSAGADIVSGGRIVAVEGSGGRDTSFADGQLRVTGEHGALTIRADGQYSYVPRPGTPENVRDVFTYTLADASGASDRARLIIEIGKTPAVVQAGAERIVPGPDGVVVLPAGVELSDIRVVGRDLVVTLPDGGQLVIVDGAVFVPQLVINNVEVPATNLAALLIDSEPQPAAGNPQSSGGSFAVPVPELGPGEPLGDLLPPTELDYTPPDFRDPGFFLEEDEDDTPPPPPPPVDNDVTVGANAAAQLDDDALPGGNPGGIGDDPDAVNLTGTLSGSGGDGQLTFDLLTSGAPAGFTYQDGPDGSILVLQGDTVVLTITVNSATGAYTVTQNAPILHPEGADENNVAFTISYTVTDEDGDSATGTLTINVDDDTPTIDVAAGADDGIVLVTDDADTIGADSDTATSSADFGGAFSLSFSPGADGTAANPSLSYALGTAGGASGLTQGGVAINLFLIGGVVVGSTAGSAAEVTADNTVFDVSVDGSGVVTLTQYSQIDHTNTDPSPTGAPYSDQLISLVDGAITLTATATYTDRDGDPASDSETIGIGANLRFSDDGPSLTEVAAASGVVIDETAAGSPAGFPISATSGGSLINATALFGADGPAASGALTYGLQVVGSGATPLATAIGDYPITLVQNGPNQIVGQYDDGSGVQTAFTVTINADGSVTVVQNVPLEHLVDGPPGPAHNDALSLAGLIEGTVTATDFDGDTASATVDLGDRIVFRDDGPRAFIDNGQEGRLLLQTQDADTIGAATDTASIDFSTIIKPGGNPGADGGTVLPLAYALGAVEGPSGLTQGGQAINLFLIGGVVVGSTATSAAGVTAANTVFDVSVSQSGVVTLNQYSQIDHPAPTPGQDPNQPAETQIVSLVDDLVTLSATQTVIDNDGDTASKTVTLGIGANLQFADDGPVTSPDTDTVPTGQTQATGNVITDAAPGDAGDSDNGADDVGADTPGRITAIAFGNSSDTSFDANGNLVIQGQFGTLTIDAQGNYVYTRTGNAGGGQSEVFTYTLTDADGDSATGTLTITIGADDLVPSAGTVGVLLDDDALPNGIPGGPGDVSPDTQNTSGLLPGSGGDGALTFSFAGNQPALPAGFAYDTSTPGVLVITQNGLAVITVTITDPATGSYTVVQNNPIQHTPGAAGTSLENNLDLALNYQVTDADGDAATGTIAIQVNDDSPVIQADLGGSRVTIDETAAGSPAGFPISATSGGSLINATALFGADGPAASGALTYGLQVVGSGATPLATAIGDYPITLVQNGPNQIVGQYNDGSGVQTAFTVTINGDGSVTVVQNVPLEHLVDGPPGPAHNDALSLAGLIEGTVTATDFDGDTASATVDLGDRIVFRDDGPRAFIDNGQEGRLILQTQDADTIGAATDAASIDFSTIIKPGGNPGADGGTVLPLAYALGATEGPSGLTQGGQAINLFLIGGVVVGSTATSAAGVTAANTVFDVSVSQSGVVTLNQYSQIDHPAPTPGQDPNQPAETQIVSLVDDLVTLSATQTVIDNDGDTASKTVTLGIGANLQFADDGPSLTDVQVGAGVTVDETAAGSPAGFPISATSGAAVLSATALFGADGPGAGGGQSFAIRVLGDGSTPLATAIGDHPITLVQVNSTTVEGRYDNGGEQLAFRVEMNADGTVTLTQFAPLEHLIDGPRGPAHNDPLDLSGLIEGSITVVDADGDRATASTDIGGALVFRDDGPRAFLDNDPDGKLILQTQDADTIGAATDTASIDFSTIIKPGGNPGADGGTVLPLAYALGATEGPSGLTQGGQAINLFLIGGVVVGSTATSAAGVTAANTVFDVSVSQSGVVTLNQYSQIDHPAPTPGQDPNQPAETQIVSLVDDLVTLSATQTVIDNDGDTASRTVTLGIGDNIRFADDAGSLGSFGGVTVANAAGAAGHGTFAYDPGADGHASFALRGPALAGYSYSTVQTDAGALLTATADPDGPGGAAAVTLFTLQVDADGTYDFTLVTPQAATTRSVSLLGLTPGGPSPFVETPDGFVEFSGSGNGINSSKQGFGVSNQFVGKGESFTIEFHATGQAGDQPADVNADYVSTATLKNDMINGSLTVKVIFHNDQTGQTETQTLAVSGSSTVLDPATLDSFNRVEIVGVGGSGQGVRFTSLDYSKTVLPADYDLSFQVQALDRDGDVTNTQTLTVSVDGGQTAAVPLAAAAAGTFSVVEHGGALAADAASRQIHRSAEGQGSGNTLALAAAAAAGLAAMPLAARPLEGADLHSAHPALERGTAVDQHRPGLDDVDGASVRSLLSDDVGAADQRSADVDRSAARAHAEEAHSGVSETAHADHGAPATTELLGGTETPAVQAPAPAAEIVMPPAEALAALMAEAKSVGGESAPEPAVGAVREVVADALSGGHAGPDIDALLAALPSSEGAEGGGNPRVDGLASHADAGVPAWDAGHLAGLPQAAVLHMEAAALHPDAIQPA